ncbi:hypothetical protein D3C78_237610 [compost metagenome]
MKKNSVESSPTWIDPDDAPEITEEWVTSADLFDGETLVRRGRPRKANPKSQVTLRLDKEVLEYFRETGEGWQTLMNDVLRAHVAKSQARRSVVVKVHVGDVGRVRSALRTLEGKLDKLNKDLQVITVQRHAEEVSKRRERA